MFEIALALASARLSRCSSISSLEGLAWRRRRPRRSAASLRPSWPGFRTGRGLRLRAWRRWRGASPSASMRRFSASASASTTMRAFSALAGASSAARRSASTRLGLGQRGLGHGPVLGFEHGGLGFALAGFAQLIGFGLLDRQLGLATRRSGPAAWFSPSMALALASATLDAHLAARRPSPARRARRPPVCSPICCSLSSSATRTACSRCGLAGADLADPSWRWPPGSPCRARPRPRAFRPSSPGRPRRRGPAEWPCDGGLLADGVDVAALVGDVGDVDVDQHQADLLQLRLERALHVLQERVAVAVDVLDPHRGDHLPQLAEDDFLGLLANLLRCSGPASGWPRSASPPAWCRWPP